MEIVTNEKLVKRNARLGQILSLAGLVVLGVGMAVTFGLPPEYVWGSMLALLVGFVLSQIGIYYTNRYGRKPRPDEVVNVALKGLDGRYSLYHFTAPTNHLLVGPAGVWVLVARPQRGDISYAKKRWRQTGGGIWLTYLKWFAQESIGRPDLEYPYEVEAVRKYLEKKLPEGQVPPVKAVLVFTHENAVIGDVAEAPIPTLNASDFKEFVRKVAKAEGLSEPRYRAVKDALATN